MSEVTIGAIDGNIHKISFRVYFEDTDAGGIVYHANYLRFAERARTEWLRMVGFEQSHLMENHGVIFVMRRAEIDYHKPVRLDDVVTIETSLQALGRTSITMLQNVHSSAELAASISVVLVCVNRNMKPIRFPEPIAAAFAKYTHHD